MDDILLCVFNYILLKDLVNCFPVSKQYNKVANHSFNCKSRIRVEFNYDLPDIDWYKLILNKLVLKK